MLQPNIVYKERHRASTLHADIKSRAEKWKNGLSKAQKSATKLPFGINKNGENSDFLKGFSCKLVFFYMFCLGPYARPNVVPYTVPVHRSSQGYLETIFFRFQ